MNVFVGRIQGGTWDSGGSNNPLHDWGFDDESGTVAAADGKLLVANVKFTADPTVTNITVDADVSDIVKGWVEGTNSNQGFVLYYDRNVFQGIGLDNPELLIVVPEPLTMLAVGMGIAGLGGYIRKRRRG